MKSEELRIGNWLIKDDGLPERVSAIFAHDVVHFLGFDHASPIILCNPIPLTEEWLVKFGFVYDDSYMCWDKVMYPYYKLCLRWRSEELGYGISLNIQLVTGRSITKFGKQSIKNVHQLQNLFFALTGEELSKQ